VHAPAMDDRSLKNRKYVSGWTSNLMHGDWLLS
jgi:hypothetical protein